MKKVPLFKEHYNDISIINICKRKIYVSFIKGALFQNVKKKKNTKVCIVRKN